MQTYPQPDNEQNAQLPSDVDYQAGRLPRHRRSAAQPLVALSLLLLGVGLGVGGNYLSAQPNSNLTSRLPSPTNAPQNQPGTLGSNSITSMVQQVGPAVVRIDSSQTVSNPQSQIFKDPFFQQFFGSQMPQVPDKETVRGTGSGFIINANGTILTNAHVVAGDSPVTVTLKDGRTFQGKVLGTDPVTDVAVVKVNANNLPTVKLGNSNALQPGETAIAIGNPFGLDNTVTEGIISATGRSSGQVGVPNQRVSFIQTDAAINPGNSGGPLLDAQGEVIGMNTAIIQGAQGLGFAIPIDTAQQIANQLVHSGKVEHAYLGIQMVKLTPEIKQEINANPNSGLSVSEDQGVLIVRVVPGSPADRAGLRAGDVIQKLDGQVINDADTLQQKVENTKVGGNLRLDVIRNGQALNLSFKPGAFPNQPSDMQG